MQNDPRYGHVPFVILSLPIFFVFSPLLSVLSVFLKALCTFFYYNMAEEKINIRTL